MNWSKVGDFIGGAAPLIGSLIAGPAGGLLGGLIASTLGVEATPDAVAAALRTNPEAAARLMALEAQHRETLEKMSLQAASTTITAVNETMRAESVSGDKWQRRWRPFWGFASAIAFFLQTGAVAYLIIVQGDPAIISSLSSLSVFWSVPLAIVGVTAWGRSREKISSATGQPPTGMLDGIVSRS